MTQAIRDLTSHQSANRISMISLVTQYVALEYVDLAKLRWLQDLSSRSVFCLMSSRWQFLMTARIMQVYLRFCLMLLSQEFPNGPSDGVTRTTIGMLLRRMPRKLGISS